MENSLNVPQKKLQLEIQLCSSIHEILTHPCSLITFELAEAAQMFTSGGVDERMQIRCIHNRR